MKIFRLHKTWVFTVFIAAVLACTPAFAAKKSKVAEDDGMSLMEMSDQLDGIDKQDFQAAIERATSCTQARDFPCAESELTKAAKSANTGKDKKTLQASRQSLANEKQELANERRRAEEVRQEEAREEKERERRNALREQQRWERQQAAEIAQARREANAWLAGEIARIPGQMQSQMAEAEAGSRGSSVAEDRAKARRQAEFDARIRDMEADPNSDLNRDKRARERERAEARHAESERAAKREASKNAAFANDARRTADMRQQDETDANARKKREADELKSRQEQEAKRRDEERRNQELRDSIERKRVAEAEAARKQAAAAATKLAEQQAKAQYLRSVASGTRLVATKCPDGAGKFYATGTRPNIKPELVACVDVHYRASCPGSRQHSNGVARNFIGMSGCFGDTYDINPKPDCNVDQVRIDIVEARVCGG